jgi:hypothetical protein
VKRTSIVYKRALYGDFLSSEMQSMVYSITNINRKSEGRLCSEPRCLRFRLISLISVDDEMTMKSLGNIELSLSLREILRALLG